MGYAVNNGPRSFMSAEEARQRGLVDQVLQVPCLTAYQQSVTSVPLKFFESCWPEL